ncbi:hypothetical protein SARC_17238, partial [Sphaeroforma arctica JP610]
MSATPRAGSARRGSCVTTRRLLGVTSSLPLLGSATSMREWDLPETAGLFFEPGNA